MGVCAFVAGGVNFDMDQYIRDTPFEVLSVFHKGDARPEGDPEDGPRPDSGFVAVVSHDHFPHLLDQVAEAVDFLEMREQDLKRLTELGVDWMALDFRVQQESGPTPTHHLPKELITAMSRWQMELAFSVEVAPEAEHHFRRFRSRRR